MSLSNDDLKKLKAPFDAKTVCVKVQSISRNKDKAALVCYIQHTDAYGRIEEVDPAWSCDVTGTEHYLPDADGRGEYFNVRIRLTIKGISRENTGEGQDMKSANSDALKRAAMLFGIGRYLYDADVVWVPYNEQTDYYKTWTLDEYHAAMRSGQTRVPTGPTPAQKQAESTPAAKGPVVAPKVPELNGKTKIQFGAAINAAATRLGMSATERAEYILEMMKKPAIKLTLSELESVLQSLEVEIARNGM